MKINELIEKMNNGNVNLKEILEIRTYIPIAEKKQIIQDVIGESYYVYEGVLMFDSIDKKMNFDVAMIKYHTNLDIDEDVVAAYDAIHGSSYGNLYEALIEEFPYDYCECEKLLDSAVEDLYRQFSVEASVGKVADTLSIGIKKVSDTLTKKTQDIDLNEIIGGNADITKILDVLVKYKK